MNMSNKLNEKNRRGSKIDVEPGGGVKFDIESGGVVKLDESLRGGAITNNRALDQETKINKKNSNIFKLRLPKVYAAESSKGGTKKGQSSGGGAKISYDNEDQLIKLNEKISRRNKILTSLVSGAIAGCVAKTTIAPLDRTKINFQVSSDKRYSLRGAIRFLIRSYKTEGMTSLWRGNSATMVRIIPYAAIQYASFEQWKHLLNPKNERFLPPFRRYLSGSLAGITAASLTYPLDVARARMAVTKKCTYKTLPQVFRKMYQTEGLISLYRGFTPALIGVIPYAGTSFFTYETLKKKQSDCSGGGKASHIQKLCFGAVAGLVGQTSSYPLDIVRRRMQTAGVTGMTHIYTSIWATLVYVARTEGVRGGLFKGLSMNWIKGPIAVGVSFTTFEFTVFEIRKYIFFQDGNTFSSDDTS